ncbi:MAG: hypothetical protein IPL52_01515 [Flavobacteriales bacterium]|nr:hypothetical protein [Flavobacteriales bacterium]
MTHPIHPQGIARTLVAALALWAAPTLSAQPYSGTIFIDPDIIIDSDPGTLVSVTYTGQGMVTVYDRRPPGWVTINAYLFDVAWNDGLTSVAMVNPEFGSAAAAAAEAQTYAHAIGKLPTCLRVDVDAIWIHAGVYPFGGGNNAILIHTGQSALYIADGILEETLVHEASHTSLDATHAGAAGWLAAQQADPNFISTYAAANPTTEDIAESFLPWIMVRHRASRISMTNYNLITNTIPNRLAYFDAMPCDLYPITSGVGMPEATGQPVTLRVFPSPASSWIEVRSGTPMPEPVHLDLIGGDGRIVHTARLGSGDRIDISGTAPGLYHWRCTVNGTVRGSGTIAVE